MRSAPGAEPQEFSPTATARQLVLAPRAVRPTVKPEVAPQVDRLVYAVIREGQDVGTHRIEFASDGNRLTVRISTVPRLEPPPEIVGPPPKMTLHPLVLVLVGVLALVLLADLVLVILRTHG